MATNANMTPLAFRKVWTSKTLWKPHFVPDAGTFNSVAYLAATNTSVLTSRWWFTLFTVGGSAANQRRASGCSFTMPDDYINGTDIKLRLYWTSDEVDAGGETVDWQIGLSRQNGTALGGETQTEYQTTASAPTSTAGEFPCIVTATLTYGGSNLTANQEIALIMTRQAASDSADNSSYIGMVEFLYQRQSITQLTSLSNRRMTPTNFAPVYRQVVYTCYESASQSGTFDGLSTGTSSIGSLSGRWKGIAYDDGQNKNRTINWITPPDYKAGSDIKLTLKYFGSTSSSNSVWIYAGLCTDSVGNTMGDETDTEYLAPAGGSPTAMSGTAFTGESLTWTFSGTNQSAVAIAKRDPICFIIVRQGTAASDNYTGDFVLINFVIEYQVDEEGELTI